jgi:hypothetical protein
MHGMRSTVFVKPRNTAALARGSCIWAMRTSFCWQHGACKAKLQHLHS